MGLTEHIDRAGRREIADHVRAILRAIRSDADDEVDRADQQAACLIVAAELFEDTMESGLPFDDKLIVAVVQRMYHAGAVEVISRFFRRPFDPTAIADDEYPVDPGD